MCTSFFFFFQAEDGIRDGRVTGVQTCALPISEPLHQQLYRQIRDELRSGNFSRSSSRLPSSRALAADLGISRLTVNLAFSELHAEGYLIAEKGSGTFVADPLPDAFLSADKAGLS